MNVLSLFDGISCGMLALKRTNIPVKNYYASEIDKYSITISQKNNCDIIQLGDVKSIFVSGYKELYKNIDLLIGGSPCQGFSFAGKQTSFGDPRSKLFFQYIRILKKVRPQYFLFENVPMKKDSINIISKYLGINPTIINSNLVSAQNRKRLYWTNIPGISQPEDKGIFLRDILECGIKPQKQYCESLETTNLTSQTMFTEKRTEEAKKIRQEYRKQGVDFSPRRNKILTQRKDGKSNCLTSTVSKEFLLTDENKTIRTLTPIECERLQTIPDNYTEGVSNYQRYKMLGNAWTVDVIAHIFKGLKNDKI